MAPLLVLSNSLLLRCIIALVKVQRDSQPHVYTPHPVRAVPCIVISMDTSQYDITCLLLLPLLLLPLLLLLLLLLPLLLLPLMLLPLLLAMLQPAM